MSWDKATIAKFAPRPKSDAKAELWDAYIEAMVDHGEELFAEFGIDTTLELQHFLSQIAHESGGFTVFRENMNYRAERISEIFGVGKHSARVTPEEAEQLAGKPDELAERVYGLGNPKKAAELGNTEPGDGARYTGTGLIQITGKADHEKYFAGDYTARQMLKAALMEFHDKGCCELANADNCKLITKKINGGYNGLDDRKVWLAKAKKVWPVFPFESEARKEEVKPLAFSETAQAGAVGTAAGSYVAVDMFGEAVRVAGASGHFDWSLFASKTVLNSAFIASAIVVVMTLRTIYVRWKKPDIGGVVTS